jgi:tellurite resistance protein TerC
VWASLRATRGQGRRAVEAPAVPPFRVATAEEEAEVEPLWRRGRRDTPEPAGTP